MRHASADEIGFYKAVLAEMERAGLPYLIGGAHALGPYTGIFRDTKDLDVFARRRDCLRALKLLERRGYRTELTSAHWLGKAFSNGYFVDFIFGSGNGLCSVDEDWFRYARRGAVFGRPVGLIPPEEMIWQKAFIMERHRFDGADVLHLLRATGGTLDWRRLLARFRDNWPVLLSHLTLFGFVYPGERDVVPPWVLAELAGKLLRPAPHSRKNGKVCRGTYLSLLEYRKDIRDWGYADARVSAGFLSPSEIKRWTASVKSELRTAAGNPRILGR